MRMCLPSRPLAISNCPLHVILRDDVSERASGASERSEHAKQVAEDDVMVAERTRGARSDATILMVSADRDRRAMW